MIRRHGLSLVFLLALGLVTLAAIPSGPVLADPTVPTFDRPLDDPAAEARARALMKEIRCVVCQSQSIDESDADIAADLRNIVREQIAAGRNEQEIEDYLTARYGDFVLLDPPFKIRTLILWLGPFALVVLAAFGVAVAMRRNRGGVDVPRPELTLAERQRLQEVLARDMQITRGSGEPGGAA
jgi:cytochrome c-type biogenesis protein CcmH